MKLITFRCDGQETVGVVSRDGTLAAPLDSLGYSFRDMSDLIEHMTDEELRRLSETEIAALPDAMPLSRLELLAPIPHPRQDILCLGINYMEHVVESARYKKEDFNGERPYPVYFSKRVSTCTPHGGFIDGHFDIQNRLDYEVELAVILRRDALNVKKDDALDYVFGYTIVNDVSSRDLQTRHKQFYFGKSLDTFTCMGPWIVTADELPGVPDLPIRSLVNGEVRQNSTTGHMIFDTPYIIEELSAGLTLKAGTVIATGTPSGVGMGFTPPRWMHSGDTVECVIEGIGTLKNTVK
ncbi:MAG: fumarylacetoacetate hydrolase family protein [Lachnospiraceae bacterium]|nr:fumarylacetoacetate hydrolase family protein [Lachnospiraceae bacterium]